MCLNWIEKEAPCEERWLLGITLGNIGDPRIQNDVRNESAYVEIRGGDYRVGTGNRLRHLSRPFWVSRFLVTNTQYAIFVADDGYNPERSWWSEHGRRWLKEQNISGPRVWRSGRWNGPNQPVVGVSFWEAEAFCAWAGGRLPSEWQWEMAAHGPAGETYPWGSSWEQYICNTRETGLGVTSPVGLFPRCRSRAYGLEDAGGNVWQWCTDLTGVADFRESRVLRGCSWNDEMWDERWLNRGQLKSDVRADHVGFRIIRKEPPDRS